MLADYRLPFGIVTSNSLSEDVIIFLKSNKRYFACKIKGKLPLEFAYVR